VDVVPVLEWGALSRVASESSRVLNTALAAALFCWAGLAIGGWDGAATGVAAALRASHAVLQSMACDISPR
jgi:hypothetical protein